VLKTKENSEHVEKRGKSMLRKEVTKWTNCCVAVGKWTSTDLENVWIMDQPRLTQGKSGLT
jgi:hypothetical protein